MAIFTPLETIKAIGSSALKQSHYKITSRGTHFTMAQAVNRFGRRAVVLWYNTEHDLDSIRLLFAQRLNPIPVRQRSLGTIIYERSSGIGNWTSPGVVSERIGD